MPVSCSSDLCHCAYCWITHRHSKPVDLSFQVYLVTCAWVGINGIINTSSISNIRCFPVHSRSQDDVSARFEGSILRTVKVRLPMRELKVFSSFGLNEFIRVASPVMSVAD